MSRTIRVWASVDTSALLSDFDTPALLDELTLRGHTHELLGGLWPVLRRAVEDGDIDAIRAAFADIDRAETWRCVEERARRGAREIVTGTHPFLSLLDAAR